MATHSIHFNPVTGIFSLFYSLTDVGQPDEPVVSNDILVPEGMWTAFASPFSVEGGGAGLLLLLESGETLEFLAHPYPPYGSVEGVKFFTFPGQQITMRVESFEDGTLVYSHSFDLNEWTEVAAFIPPSPVVEVGLVLRYDTEERAASARLAQFRLLPGIWENNQEEVWIDGTSLTARAATRDVVEIQPLVNSTAEPYVHAIVGAQFGDLEYDVGKSVRWQTWFVDNLFVLDVNLGTPRYWIVNWTETFPDAEHRVTNINYFVVPAKFRQEQWKQYKLTYGEPYDDEWFLFVDAHEGLSVDNRSLPNDYSFAPFKSFLWREIQRAIDAGNPYAILPYYVFLRSANITNVSYVTPQDGAIDPETGLPVPPVLQALSVPYYQAYQGAKRLWQASELKKANFDWTQIDTPVAPSAGAKAQIISYGYAHWNLQDIEPPATTVPPLDANNDDGWRMRNLLSKVRPIPGLPIGDWVSPASDPAGLPGPWAPADANNPDPIHPTTGLPLAQPVPPDSSLLGLVTPLYDCVFRINMRDGVWYEEGLSGNIPLVWDGTKWTTDYDPALWADRGVESWDPTAVP